MNPYAIDPNCKYPNIVVSSLWFTDAEIIVCGLCLCGKEIFEKLNSKESSSLF